MTKAVLFDVDGTLIDSVDLHARAWQDAFHAFGKDVAFPDIRAQIGKGGDNLTPVFLTEAEEQQFGEALRKYRGRHFRDNYRTLVKPFPKVPELFAKLQEDNWRVVLVSSSEKGDLDHFIHVLGVKKSLNDTVCGDDVKNSKPDPDLFHAALRAVKLQPHQVLAVGDTPYDAEAAGKAGIRTIGVRCGGFPDDKLLQAGCLALYDDPADLLARYPFSHV